MGTRRQKGAKRLGAPSVLPRRLTPPERAILITAKLYPYLLQHLLRDRGRLNRRQRRKWNRASARLVDLGLLRRTHAPDADDWTWEVHVRTLPHATHGVLLNWLIDLT